MILEHLTNITSFILKHSSESAKFHSHFTSRELRHRINKKKTCQKSHNKWLGQIELNIHHILCFPRENLASVIRLCKT